MFMKRLVDVAIKEKTTHTSSGLRREKPQNYTYKRLFCQKTEQVFCPDSIYKETTLDSVTFIQCVLYNSLFFNAKFRDFIVKYSSLASCNFNEAVFGTGVHITWSNIGYATFKGALIENCNLQHNYFLEADFTRAILRRSNLSRSNLTRANFSGANLSETNICGANLNNIIYTPDTVFSGVIYDRDTVFPKTFDMKRLR